MENVPPLETVYQALQALYNNPDVVGKEKASVWLGELQRSVFAWQVADQLLRHNQDLESCYFAAQTMRTKIQYAFHELPVASHQSLRDSLLDHVGKITFQTPPVIVTQLCLALADLALQMTSWKSAATDLIQKFGNNIEQMPFLLEVLTVLPEEINSRSLRLGANRRSDVTEELKDTAAIVMQLLTACVESNDDNIKLTLKVFRCLSSWFSVGAVPQEIIVGSGLLTTPFKTMVQKDCGSGVHEAATDCICAALYCAEDLGKNFNLAESLFQGVMTLPEAYHRSIADEDLDKSLNFCRVFTEMAESFLDLIVNNTNQGLGDLQTLELLLMCVGHHLYEVAEITFNFWYRLSELLFQRGEDELNNKFRPIIQRLIVTICRHCQMDSDHDGVPDESDDFGDFRMRASELIKDVVFIVGSSTCFTQMFDALKNQSETTSWDASEAALFIMSAVAKNILPEENVIVPQVVQAILSLSETAHVSVRYTSIQLIGGLCEWIETHPHLLDPVLQFLLSGLQQKQLATVAATSLQNICTTCKEHMTEHFQGLVQIVEAVDTFNVSNEAAIGLLRGAATILGRLPHSKITEGLKHLCKMQITPLSKFNELETIVAPELEPLLRIFYTSMSPPIEILTETTELPRQGSNLDPTIWLDRLAAIFRYTNPSITNGQVHPCQPVVQEIWPVLSEACSKYQSDIRIVERCCRCIRFAVRCLGKGSASLLQPLVTQMVALYGVHQHSCFLYLGSILVDEYGMEESCVPWLLEMFQAFCGPTFKILEESNGFRNHPDTVDDLFRLSVRFIQRAPVPFLGHQMATPIMLCAIAAVSLDHKDANTSVTKFLIDLFRCGREKEEKENFEARRSLVKSLVQEHGQALTVALINAGVFCLPSFMIVDVADVVYELMLVDRPTFCGWLETTLKSLPNERSGGSISATQKQLADFHKTVTSAESEKYVSVAMRDFSRLYR